MRHRERARSWLLVKRQRDGCRESNVRVSLLGHATGSNEARIRHASLAAALRAVPRRQPALLCGRARAAGGAEVPSYAAADEVASLQGALRPCARACRSTPRSRSRPSRTCLRDREQVLMRYCLRGSSAPRRCARRRSESAADRMMGLNAAHQAPVHAAVARPVLKPNRPAGQLRWEARRQEGMGAAGSQETAHARQRCGRVGGTVGPHRTHRRA